MSESTEPSRIEVTSLQLRRLRREVFCDQGLSRAQRQSAVGQVLPFPTGGGRVDLYCDGKFLGKV